MSQHGDDLVETIERVRPTMRQDKRGWVWAVTAFVNEVNFYAVHLGLEVVELVEGGFVLAPVIRALPISGQFLHVRQACPHTPTGVLRFNRPASPFQPLLKIVER